MKLTEAMLVAGVRVKCTYNDTDVYGKFGIIRDIIAFELFHIRWDDDILNRSTRGINPWGRCNVFEIVDCPENTALLADRLSRAREEDEKRLDQKRRQDHAMKFF